MKKHNNISDIPARNYQGYIWDADAKEPEMINGQLDLSTYAPESYIIEALLYCKEDNTSVHIRHSGKEHIYEFDMNNLPSGAQLSETSFLPHRLGKDIEKVFFQELWIPEKDPYCEDMEVLKMKALIFSGFENKKQEK